MQEKFRKTDNFSESQPGSELIWAIGYDAVTALFVELLAAKGSLTEKQADDFRVKLGKGEEDDVFEKLCEMLLGAK